jgi:hypothetical protein
MRGMNPNTGKRYYLKQHISKNFLYSFKAIINNLMARKQIFSKNEVFAFRLRNDNVTRLPLPARHLSEAKPMADGKGEAARGLIGRCYKNRGTILCRVYVLVVTLGLGPFYYKNLF